MHILTTIALGTALLIPTCAIAQDHDHGHDHDRDQRQRYYDKHHRDYHEFDARENRAWHIYAEQQRRSNWRWEQAKERERQQYWNWRHNHSDAILQINIR
jgi:hypothetical protein